MNDDLWLWTDEAGLIFSVTTLSREGYIQDVVRRDPGGVADIESMLPYRVAAELGSSEPYIEAECGFKALHARCVRSLYENPTSTPLDPMNLR